jgi:hypothetical protein
MKIEKKKNFSIKFYVNNIYIRKKTCKFNIILINYLRYANNLQKIIVIALYILNFLIFIIKLSNPYENF